MEEGSPGVFLKNYRFAKGSRADSGRQDGLVSDANPDLMTAHDLNPGVQSVIDGASFRDKLMNKVNLVKNIGIDVNSLDTNYDELNDDEDVVISQGDRGPSIQFSEKAMSRLCKPWKNALIAKLLGRSHTYNYLHDRLQQKWSLKGGWETRGFDLEFVLTGGPWIIAGQYLVLQKWKPGFCPATAHITRMATWIRVSAIHLECFDVWALKRIGNLLGKLLKIDALTTSQNRGKFARMCVEPDLTKRLEAFVQIYQEWYNIEYEGLPDICYLCGRYGHKREHCEKRNSAPVAVPEEGQSSVVEDVLEGNVAMNNEELLENLRGPWMNVPAMRRPKAMHKDQGGRNNGVRTKGSRFDALHGVSENFGRKEVIGNGVDGKSVVGEREPTTRDVGLGKKVCTKSKAVKPDVRAALNDISNKPQQDKKHLTAAALIL
ncbi:PREDICTED: reverse mRNAase [Prunus dulcis]|uniref:PREDICTED: reverse mRNAase n=1 Tax=Prunus dulcis TaxID=3755 RepID=A0A5E4GJP5_PRUDU|nr:PREDICTED: reverse mRNAase [Prunus dulcis]